MNVRIRHPETGQETIVGSEAEADYHVKHGGWEKVSEVRENATIGLQTGTIVEDVPQPASIEDDAEAVDDEKPASKKSSSRSRKS